MLMRLFACSLTSLWHNAPQHPLITPLSVSWVLGFEGAVRVNKFPFDFQK